MSPLAITAYDFKGAYVRTCVDDKGSPWFFATDVCRVLELTNPSDALKGLDDDERDTLANSEGVPLDRSGAQSYNIISESGLYSLVLRSRKPEAKVFKKWVTNEVLPSIRKTGSYSAPEAALALPDFSNPAAAARAWAAEYEAKAALQIENKELVEKVKVNKHKAQGFDQLINCEGLISINAAAKNMNFKKMGQNNLIAFMAGTGVLMRGGYKQRSWVPTQRHIEAKRFEVKQRTFNLPDGELGRSFTTYFTQAGLLYMMDKLANAGHKRNSATREDL